MLKNKTILVTGAASGIGKETAAQLKKHGAKVIGADINEAADVDTFIKVDLSSKSSIDELVRKLPKGINGLANIAGVSSSAPAELILKINLVGLKYLTEQVIDKLADGAAIVNLSSLAGNNWEAEVPLIKKVLTISFDDVPAFAKENNIDNGNRAYAFSKEALILWTMANRWEWTSRGIRMNTVSPGPVETPILKDFRETLGDRFDQDSKLVERLGTPTDIAPVVVFMISDDSKWIRGANIPVDGGIYQHILLNRANY
ncbi:MAG: coniferyl-alcohol dehydrogenase [Aequorivita sp.]